MATRPNVVGSVRRRVFVSYHHDEDQVWHDTFSQIFSLEYDLIWENSLDRRAGSANPEYILRRIREDFLYGSSVIVVLCGKETAYRKYVDWEIHASLNQEMGLVGIFLPTISRNERGQYVIPARLYDNIQRGYALGEEWMQIERNPWLLRELVEMALKRDKRLMDNARPRMSDNWTPYGTPAFTY